MLVGYLQMSEFFIKLDTISVKGKTEGVDIYTILEPKNIRLAREMRDNIHSKMLWHYSRQEWETAARECDALKGAFDGQLDYYYAMMCDRITEYMNDESLPKDWNGTYVAKSK